MIDFSKQPSASEAVSEAVFSALKEARDFAAPREYLGVSRIGEECERALQFEYEHKAKERGFEGRTYAIFDRGHWGEEYLAYLLKKAGFELWTEKASGEQFGFEDLDGKVKGHIDGAIVDAPDGVFHVKPTKEEPALWENKILGSKSWRDLLKKKLAVSKPVYYAQVVTYQAYMGFTNRPALFTAVNADTMEIYAELVEFDAPHAQRMIDKALRIITASEAKELSPRAATSPDHFVCKFCEYKSLCWGDRDA